MLRRVYYFVFDEKVHHMILIIVSNNLQITDVKLTGLSFTDLFLKPFLNKGIIIIMAGMAVFYVAG